MTAFVAPLPLTHRALLRHDVRTRRPRHPSRMCIQPNNGRRPYAFEIAVSQSPAAAPAKPKPAVPPHVEAFLSRSREGDPLTALQRAERTFDTWKAGPRPYKRVVHDERGVVDDTTVPDVDVAIAGGTLGVFYATALAARGVRVALIERGRVQGRAQEWNISRGELNALVEQGVLTVKELEVAIVNEFAGGSRIAFPPTDRAREINVRGVLDVGVDPAVLVASARARFEAFGGQVIEFASLEHVSVRENCVCLTLTQQQRSSGGDGAMGAGGTSSGSTAAAHAEAITIRARLLIDAMGVFSPIAAQMRKGAAPDGACVVVGSCVSGVQEGNDVSDLLCAIDDIDTDKGVQYFWEAFPAGRERDRRTTYMFSYGACDPSRHTLTDALDDYVRTMPRYQQTRLCDVDVQRVLFAFFPVFRDSPARVAFDRVLPVGDAAGFQSPISFGGFGACLRHLRRVVDGVEDALGGENDVLLSKAELERMQFYNPSLSVTWLFNSAMSVGRHKLGRGGIVDAGIINDLLYCNMRSMERLGEKVQKPFLQDVVRAGGLSKTILAMMVLQPWLAVRTALFVQPIELLKWTPHYLALVMYTILAPIVNAYSQLVDGNLNAVQRYRLNRVVDALEYGAGLDYDFHH